MIADKDPPSPAADAGSCEFSLRRLVPLLAIAAVSIGIVLVGGHRHLSFESLARHHEALRDFIAVHEVSAVAAYVAIYIAAVALSLPVGFYLTVIGGILFGAVLGAVAAMVGATVGAVCIFLIAKSALGEHLVRRAGPLAEKLANGFREDAFNYLLFLRLVPIFPFWVINLVSALLGVRLATFAAATALGVVPATFVFAFVGAGLDSVIVAQQAAYQSCLAAGRADCRLEFHLNAAATPELLVALAALGVLALIPVVVKRLRTRSRLTRPSG
ncbi:MAG: VTT domain-containing protein [Xanthobacteraceae bacterium]